MAEGREPLTAVDDLEERFGTPAALAETTALSVEDRIALLERWRLDALRLSDSEQEGMGGGEAPHLAEIERLILKLKGV
jgi:hypothetical protein